MDNVQEFSGPSMKPGGLICINVDHLDVNVCLHLRDEDAMRFSPKAGQLVPGDLVRFNYTNDNPELVLVIELRPGEDTFVALNALTGKLEQFILSYCEGRDVLVDGIHDVNVGDAKQE